MRKKILASLFISIFGILALIAGHARAAVNPVAVAILMPVSVTDFSASFTAKITNDAEQAIHAGRKQDVIYSTSPTFAGAMDSPQPVDNTGNVNATIYGLAPNTTYYVKLLAFRGSSVQKYSPVYRFVTASTTAAANSNGSQVLVLENQNGIFTVIDLADTQTSKIVTTPTFTLNPPTNIIPTTPTNAINISTSITGAIPPDIFGIMPHVASIEYSASPYFANPSYESIAAIDDAGTVSSTLSNLEPDTTYYARLKITIGGTQTTLRSQQIATWKTVKDTSTGSGSGALTIDPFPTSMSITDPNNKNCTDSGTIDGTYCLLEPLPGGFTEVAPTTGLASYLSIIFKVILGIITVLSVVMIIVGGVQYLTTDAIGGKEYGKETITNAIGGLVLALGSWLLLNTINPDLLSLKINVQKTCVNGFVANADGTPSDKPCVKISAGPFVPPGDITQAIGVGFSKGGLNTAAQLPAGVSCPGSGGTASIARIVDSFTNHMTYVYGAKGVAGPNGTIEYDCSGFVDKVLTCAGLPLVAGGIDSGSALYQHKGEKITSHSDDWTTVNGKPLVPGDILGIGTEHVVMYRGAGTLADSHGPANVVGQSLGTFSLDWYPKKNKPYTEIFRVK